MHDKSKKLAYLYFYIVYKDPTMNVTNQFVSNDIEVETNITVYSKTLPGIIIGITREWTQMRY